MARPDAGPPPPREGNQFKEMQLALDAAPLGLKVLGMASDEWATLEPAAAVQISDALARQATVFESVLRSHLAEQTQGARVWEEEDGGALDGDEAIALEERRLEERRRLGEADEVRSPLITPCCG